MKLSLTSVLAALGLALSIHVPAHAQAPGAAQSQPVKFALCFDLTKVSFFLAVPEAQAIRDYAQVLNAKGGIDGHPIEIMLQDHGNEVQRGIECYEKMKREGAVTFDFLSSPITKALIPRLMKENNILLSSFGGRSDAIDGEVFKWIYPIGPTYWGQAATKIQYIKNKSGGNLKGKKIAFIYVDYPFGQEPIPMLKALAQREGFDLQLFPHPLPGNDQAAAWSQIRRFNPDWVIAWNFASMHGVAAREMKRNAVAMDKYITLSLISEADINAMGADVAKGLKRTINVVGTHDHPLKQEIVRELYDKGRGNGPRETVFTTYYNVGLAVYAPIFEAARLAIRQEGWPLTPDKMRRGLESLHNYDAAGLMGPVTVTAKDHGGGGKTRIEMWDGAKWVAQSDWMSAYDDLVWDLARQGSAEFAKTNP